MTSNHHAPYVLGYTRNTMAVNKGRQSREAEQTPKSRPSSDCRLQPACMKSESLVIADQHAAVNTFPGLVHTARHTMRAGGPEVGSLTARRTPPKVKLVIGVKS